VRIIRQRVIQFPQPFLPPLTSSRPHRIALRVLLGAAALVLVLAAAGPAAAAAKPCGLKVIDDWYDNGRVDGSYPLHCYDDAIDELPRDVKDYSSAKDDIERALQARMNGQDAPPAAGDPTPNDPGSDPAAVPGPETGEDGDVSGTPPSKDGDDGGVPEAGVSDVDTASSDSVPVPLLVLAGLALLLVLAGSAGYLTRRLQARRLPPPA
jgi:hypothetical protein